MYFGLMFAYFILLVYDENEMTSSLPESKYWIPCCLLSNESMKHTYITCLVSSRFQLA